MEEVRRKKKHTKEMIKTNVGFFSVVFFFNIKSVKYRMSSR